MMSFFFQAEDGIRDHCVTGVQTCALPICSKTQMARYLRIRCIVKTERTGAHERISAICGLAPDGSHWTLTHGDAVSQVESGTCAFYIERPGGQRAEVIVAMDVHAHKYLKTV